MIVSVDTEITDDMLRGLLCTALEGGSNYWYMVIGYEFPKGISYEDFREGGEFTLDDYWHPLELIPFVQGCALKFGEMDDHPGTFILNREALYQGVRVMASKYPKHFADFLEENGDADTGDVYLQCCLFGDVIFG